MVFLSICTALYDYVPQAEGELPIREGELVYIIEKSTEDEWWKAKKKAPGEEEEEPVGLIPNNYVEEVRQSGYYLLYHPSIGVELSIISYGTAAASVFLLGSSMSSS